MRVFEQDTWHLEMNTDRALEFVGDHSNREKNKKKQIYRNFKMYCKTMPEEEAKFFSLFGIDPLNCEFKIGQMRNNVLYTHTYYLLSGNLIDRLQIKEQDYLDYSYKIGIFEFQFYPPPNFITSKDGFIGVCCNMELPWLLKEKFNLNKYLPKERNILKKFLIVYQRKIEMKNKTEDFLKKNGVKFHKHNRFQTDTCVRTWLNKFAPFVNKNNLHEIFVYRWNPLCGFLWHVFSYEVIPSEKNLLAQNHYHKMVKNTCYIIVENGNSRLSYKIDHVEKLLAEQIDEFDDIILFNTDYTWTYCHTHESECGPYFLDNLGRTGDG